MATDMVASASTPLLAVWLYEIANSIVLLVQGCTVTLSTAGLLPLGVAGVSSGGLSPFTKALQVLVAVIFMLPVGVFFSQKRLVIAETFVLSTVGIYLASAYWEMLSVLSGIPMVVHIGLFVAGADALTITLLWTLSSRLGLRWVNLPHNCDVSNE